MKQFIIPLFIGFLLFFDIALADTANASASADVNASASADVNASASADVNASASADVNTSASADVNASTYATADNDSTNAASNTSDPDPINPIVITDYTSAAPTDTGTPYVKIFIEPNNEAQAITGFGASDAWGCQFIGQHWPLEKREQVADWLFSNDTLANGQPRGAGLSIWRFNIGGGTAEQGDSSYIADEWRRAECFLNADGTYNWQKQTGQQWFLQAAKKRGTDYFVAFSNTPPVHYTKNGKGWSPGGSSVNLAPENYGRYADFLTNVLTHFEEQNFHFGILSPFNEPQWNWDGKGQEGTPCQNTEIYQVIMEISKSISRAGLDTKIEMPEAGQIDYLILDSTNLPDRDNQVFDFFNPASPLYLGMLPNLTRSIAGHSYYSTYDTEHMKRMRSALYNKIQATNKNLAYNMTEYCVLEDNSEIKGGKRDLGMQAALYVAKVIHYDLTLAHASSWQWWVAVSPYDYKDGLVYTDMNKTDGNIYDSKILWALGQYSFFVKPGMLRIESTTGEMKGLGNSEESLLASAFKSKDNKTLITVVVNLSDCDDS